MRRKTVAFLATSGRIEQKLACAEKALQWLTEHGAKRNESIAVIGGGTVLDLGLLQPQSTNEACKNGRYQPLYLPP